VLRSAHGSLKMQDPKNRHHVGHWPTFLVPPVLTVDINYVPKNVPPSFCYNFEIHEHIELIMAALWYRAGHYVFALWFLSFFFFLA